MPARIGPKRPVRVFLREWREHLGMTQEEVGSRFDPEVPKGTISKLEKKARNEPIGDDERTHLTHGAIAAYAEALHVPISKLYHLPPREDDRPSLDPMAAKLDDKAFNSVLELMGALSRRRAG